MKLILFIILFIYLHYYIIKQNKINLSWDIIFKLTNILKSFFRILTFSLNILGITQVRNIIHFYD